MLASGPLHPLRTDGTTIDATFELVALPVFEIVYHHKSGARGSPRSVNADYHEGLEALLIRMASIGVVLLGISVDSSVAHELAPEDRELALDFPIEVGHDTDCLELRKRITRAQKSVARREGAKPGGGNDQKRIRITFSLNHPRLGFDGLRTLLLGQSSFRKASIPPAS